MAGDVLSQDEIDALLSALSTGEVDADEIKEEQQQRKIKVYDFRRPDKFSKDQIRTLYMLHENFARLLNTYLSAQLRAMVQVSVASVDQLTYEEFIRSLPNPSVISVLEMQPLKGNAILEINPSVVFATIDRLFGGSGQTASKARPLTDIEENIVRRVLGRTLESLAEAWKQVVPLKPVVDVIETNPQFSQIVPPNDMVVLITLQAKVGQGEGFINLCIPYLVLEPIMSKLSTTYWVAGTGRNASTEHIQSLQRRVEKIKVPVIVELGKTTVNLQELLDLRRGDVLQLDRKVDEDLQVMIGSHKKFFCKAGAMGSKLAIQVSSVIEEGDEPGE
ncbi:MAG TPA: flagellar motor switch protein FliM [Negativicutes bacterium]|nr:flagellar motor switch protein FliM [Negativicutes bacterium]